MIKQSGGGWVIDSEAIVSAFNEKTGEKGSDIRYLTALIDLRSLQYLSVK